MLMNRQTLAVIWIRHVEQGSLNNNPSPCCVFSAKDGLAPRLATGRPGDLGADGVDDHAMI